MSAVLKDPPRLGTLCTADLDHVLEIERGIYTHPWTRGNFIDSLSAGYHCHVYRLGGELIGYFVMIVAAGEAHLLNLSVASARQRQGIGGTLLAEAMRIGTQCSAKHVFLEVRPSNAAALALYDAFKFKRIATRKGYYPAEQGHEDALVLSLDL